MKNSGEKNYLKHIARNPTASVPAKAACACTGLMPWLFPALREELTSSSQFSCSPQEARMHSRPEERGGFVLGWTCFHLARDGIWQPTGSALSSGQGENLGLVTENNFYPNKWNLLGFILQLPLLVEADGSDKRIPIAHALLSAGLCSQSRVLGLLLAGGLGWPPLIAGGSSSAAGPLS